MKLASQHIKWLFFILSFIFLIWGLKYSRHSEQPNDKKTEINYAELG